MPKKNKKLALKVGIQTYQILTNDDEVQYSLSCTSQSHGSIGDTRLWAMIFNKNLHEGLIDISRNLRIGELK